MDSYLTYQAERMARATTLADIRRTEEQLSRAARAMPESAVVPGARLSAGRLLGFLTARRRAARGHAAA